MKEEEEGKPLTDRMMSIVRLARSIREHHIESYDDVSGLLYEGSKLASLVVTLGEELDKDGFLPKTYEQDALDFLRKDALKEDDGKEVLACKLAYKVKEGDKSFARIDAIKVYRKITGDYLKESKEAIERHL